MEIIKKFFAYIVKIFKFLWITNLKNSEVTETKHKKLRTTFLILRNILVIYLFIICVSNIISVISFHLYNIKACWGKDVCVIQGPDLKYARRMPSQSELINDRYVVIVGGENPVKKENSFFIEMNPFSKNLVIFKMPIILKKKYDLGSNNIPEVYDAKLNKFVKTNYTVCSYVEPTIYKDYAKNKVLIRENGKCATDVFFNPDKVEFESISKTFNEDFVDKNRFMSKKSFYATEIIPLNDEKYIKQNISTLELHDINLDKIIKFDNKYTNSFLFTIKEENGDILFVNRKSSYVFKNKENKFVPTDKKTTEKLVNIIKRLQEYSKFYFSEPRLEYLSINRLENNKFLFTWEEQGFEKSTIFNLIYSTSSEKYSFIYDYDKDLISVGPVFKYKIENLGLTKIGKNKWFVSGYTKDGETRPHKHSQILIIKDRKDN